MSSEKKDDWLEIYNSLQEELALLRMLMYDLKTQMFPDERSLENIAVDGIDKVKYHYSDKSGLTDSISIIFNDKEVMALDSQSISELYKHLDSVLSLHEKIIELAQIRVTHHATLLKELKDNLTPLLFASKL